MSSIEHKKRIEQLEKEVESLKSRLDKMEKPEEKRKILSLKK